MNRPVSGGFAAISRAAGVAILRRRRATPAEQAADAHQVVGREREQRLRVDPGQSDEAGLAHPADGLDPTEGFLDLFALADTDGVAGMTRGAR